MAGELAWAANGVDDVELVEVDDAAAMAAGEEDVGEAVIPVDIFGVEGVAGVDGLG